MVALLALSTKAEYMHALWSSDSTLCSTANRKEYICSSKDAHWDVHSPKLKTTEMAINS